jgi:hypothetical protein
MCDTNGNCTSCTSCANTNQVTRPMNNTLPTNSDINAITPNLRAIAKNNPRAARTALEQQGFSTQGMSDEGLFGMMLKFYSEGQFNPGVLNGTIIGRQVDGRIITPNGDANKDMGDWEWQDYVGATGTAIGSFFGFGNQNQNTQNQNLNNTNNANLIAGMQQSTVYMLAGIAAVVVILIVFLSVKKK